MQKHTFFLVFLLSRLLKKRYAEHFGSDSDFMAKFMDQGNSIPQPGGVFKHHFEDTRISDVFITKPSIKAYAEIFGDFVIYDGTHNVDQYGLVAIFETWVDSLGKSVISCYSRNRLEHLVNISTALKYFGLDRKPKSRIFSQYTGNVHPCWHHFSMGCLPRFHRVDLA